MQTAYSFEKQFDDSLAAWSFLKYLGAHYEPPEGFGVVCRENRLLFSLKAEDPALSRLIKAYFKAGGSAKDDMELFCDGGSRGNPGPGAGAFVLLKDGKVFKEGGRFFARCTNNQAEYWGLKLGLEAVVASDISRLHIYLDSQLIVRQIKGEYKIKNQGLLPLYKAAKGSLAKLQQYQIVHVSRHLNHLADGLVNRIIDDNI